MSSGAAVGAKILVVDDEPAIRDLVTRHLREMGHEVYAAGDGVEALEMVEQVEPELVILDVMMPRLNGWEVARRLRRDPETRDIKILMFSTLGADLLGNTLPVFGGDAAIDKPFELEELEKKVTRLLQTPLEVL
jgi:CheY-like chemotaxis protein